MPRVAATAPRLKSLKPAERDIQRAVRDFMTAKGFRVLRMHSGLFGSAAGATRVGEKGMSDLLAIRYRDGAIVWIETKAPKSGLRPEQFYWQCGERERGATAIWTVDSIDKLIALYGAWEAAR